MRHMPIKSDDNGVKRRLLPAWRRHDAGLSPQSVAMDVGKYRRSIDSIAARKDFADRNMYEARNNASINALLSFRRVVSGHFSSSIVLTLWRMKLSRKVDERLAKEGGTEGRRDGGAEGRTDGRTDGRGGGGGGGGGVWTEGGGREGGREGRRE